MSLDYKGDLMDQMFRVSQLFVCHILSNMTEEYWRYRLRLMGIKHRLAYADLACALVF